MHEPKRATLGTVCDPYKLTFEEERPAQRFKRYWDVPSNAWTVACDWASDWAYPRISSGLSRLVRTAKLSMRATGHSTVSPWCRAVCRPGQFAGRDYQSKRGTNG